MRRLKTAAAVTAVVALAAAGCGAPKKSGSGSGSGAGSDIGLQQKVIDPDAKGPAPAVPGSKKGGTVTVYAQTTPATFDPTDIYYVDSNEIGRLFLRTPTSYQIRNGKPTLVPDLTDVGKVSDNGLTWTFTMKTGLKYENGDEIKVEDLEYAIKRGFARDVYAQGPAYHTEYFKDGDKYKGPYKSKGKDFAGVKTEGTDKLIINLEKPFSDLPFYMSFPMFAPLPESKDTKQEYKNKPVSSGPYKWETFKPGTELKLVRNEHWDADSDPVRHQFADAWHFKWGQDLLKTQKQVLNSNGPDANALNYDSVDASLLPELTGAKSNQLLTGDSPCNIVVNLDTRKIPEEVRKAIAKAYPYDQLFTAAGLTRTSAERSSTILPPSVPGYQKYTPVEDLDGTGQGDPAAAKKILEEAGKTGFELSWYYDNTKSVDQQVNQIRVDALKKAGFKVKAIGVPTADLRTKKGDYDAAVNMLQSPGGWCSDWPTGGSWFPVLFRSRSVKDGQSWGMLSDKALDKKIEKAAELPAEEATKRWTELDKEIMGEYAFLPFYYDKTAVVVGANIGGGEADPTMGMPLFSSMFLKS